MTAGLFDPSKPFPRPGWPAGLAQAAGQSLSGKRSSPMDLDSDDLGLTQDQKKLRLQSSMRMLKDEPVPEGYSRFRWVIRSNFYADPKSSHCENGDGGEFEISNVLFMSVINKHEIKSVNEFELFVLMICRLHPCQYFSLHKAELDINFFLLHSNT